MIKFYINDIKRILNIEEKEYNCIINYVSDDIKKISNNTVIFHLNKSVEVNHRKLSTLFDCFIVTDQPLLKNNINKDKYLFVNNVANAYHTFIKHYRSLFKIPIVAVTGTCGKTSTKEMISQILKIKYNVVHTVRSKNALHYHNDYLMSFNENTDFGIFETAITHPGNLIYTCEFFKPTIGIITTIGIDHLNKCKSLENYIRTKGEMLTGLSNSGILIINNDDLNIKRIDMSNYQGKIVTFGIKQLSDFNAENIAYNEGGMTFTLIHNNNSYNSFVPGYGVHNVYNALASIAALYYLGVGIKEAIFYLKLYKPVQSHIEFKEGINNSIIIDDTWSSNPTSMKAALKVLSEVGKDKIKIAVIGKISYLGDFESKSYEQIAKMIVKNKIDILVTQDINAKEIGVYAIKYGFDSNKIFHCQSKNDLKNTIGNLLNNNTIALFKWSMLDKSNKDVLDSLIVKEHIK